MEKFLELTVRKTLELGVEGDRCLTVAYELVDYHSDATSEWFCDSTEERVRDLLEGVIDQLETDQKQVSMDAIREDLESELEEQSSDFGRVQISTRTEEEECEAVQGGIASIFCIHG